MTVKFYSPRKYIVSEQALRRCIFLVDPWCPRIPKFITFQLSNNFGHLCISIFFVLCCACFSVSSAAEDTSVNRLLASQCAQCHGPDGEALGDMEKLTDESAKDLFEDLNDMREEDQPENIMDHQALGYSQAQIHRISRYFGSLKAKNEDEDKEKDKEEQDEEKQEDEDSEKGKRDEDEDEDEDEDDKS